MHMATTNPTKSHCCQHLHNAMAMFQDHDVVGVGVAQEALEALEDLDVGLEALEDLGVVLGELEDLDVGQETLDGHHP